MFVNLTPTLSQIRKRVDLKPDSSCVDFDARNRLKSNPLFLGVSSPCLNPDDG